MKQKYVYYNNNFVFIYKIIIVSIWIALTTTLRYLLIFLPNIELVTFFLMLSVITFTWKISLSIINIFCLVQIILFGFADFAYFYIFNLYWIFFFLFKKILIYSKFFFSFFIFLCGILFGFLYAIEYLFLINFSYALSYWISGIIFDIIHAVGNCIFSIILFNFLINFLKILAETKPFMFNSQFLKSLLKK